MKVLKAFENCLVNNKIYIFKKNKNSTLQNIKKKKTSQTHDLWSHGQWHLKSTGGRSLILCYELIQRINQFAVCPTALSFKSGWIHREKNAQMLRNTSLWSWYTRRVYAMWKCNSNDSELWQQINLWEKYFCSEYMRLSNVHQWPRNKSAWSQFVFALLFNKVTIQTSSIRERWGGQKSDTVIRFTASESIVSWTCVSELSNTKR